MTSEGEQCAFTGAWCFCVRDAAKVEKPDSDSVLIEQGRERYGTVPGLPDCRWSMMLA